MSYEMKARVIAGKTLLIQEIKKNKIYPNVKDCETITEKERKIAIMIDDLLESICDMVDAYIKVD